MARILLTGAAGMLGGKLLQALSSGHDLTATSRRGGNGMSALDVCDRDAARAAVDRIRPDWIVNAAAYTATDRAEAEPERAWEANCAAPALLAAEAERAGCRILHVSTDFVFSGSKGESYVESDPVGPRGVYASSKAAGEAAVRAACPDRHAIVRVSWLYGPGGGNFVASMLRLARERERLRIVADQRGTPTYTGDAAAMIRRILDEGLGGTIHAANRGETTWFELARETLSLAGISTPVEPIATAGYPTACPRPACSALRNAVLEATIGDSMRPWREALQTYLKELGTIP